LARDSTWLYLLPELAEFAVSIGFVAWALMMFQIAVRLLPITGHHAEEEAKPEHAAPEATPAA